MQRRIGVGIATVTLVLSLAACSDSSSPADATGGSGGTTTGTGVGTSGVVTTGPGPDSGSESSDDSDTTGPEPLPDVWEPGVLLPSDQQPHPRGLLDRRGLIHTHSPFSHDACDEMPRDSEGNLNAQCLQDLRRALCQVRHDYVMLTDHRESFSTSEFPDVLLYDAARGDALLERDGMAVGNWAGCDTEAPGVAPTLVLAGCEAATMSVALPQHAPGRGETYGQTTPAAIAELKDTGAVVLVAHAEDWEAQELIDMDIDGFEMFNLHANLFTNIAAGLEIVNLALNDPEALPHSDLMIMPIFSEDPVYLDRWGTVLSQGVQRVTTAGTDAHRNTFTELLPDGERIDSYRRMMHWFSNHLLLEDDGEGGFDDRALANALRSGRLYAAFEYLGYPRGFDAFATLGDVTTEIGGQVTMADGLQINATAPTVRRLDPDATPPVITVHVLRAIDGGFEEVADGDAALSWTVDEPGAYRVEVRMTPHHLQGYLGSYEALADAPRIWIYANPIYVVP